MLSVLAGKDLSANGIRGPASGATFLLAKTDKIGPDFAAEEDYFSMAVVWGELRGARIFSISIGYYTFYTWAQFDGQTAKTTIAINHGEYIKLQFV